MSQTARFSSTTTGGADHHYSASQLPQPSLTLNNSNNNGELNDLHHRYRTLEVNRRALASTGPVSINNNNTVPSVSSVDDTQNTLRMQRQQIDKLKKDNDRLKEDLALETRQAKQANNQSASATIAKLQDTGDLYSRKIELEKRRCEELDKAIRKLQQEILNQRKENFININNNSTESSYHTNKQIRILENRLDKALVKFNEALAHNKQLRETIENLRRERVVFDGIYRKLERELTEKKLRMAEIIDISNSAYENRDAAQAEMMSLKDQADREQQNFESEWAQLGALIEKDRKLKDYLKNKERERTMLLGGRSVGGGFNGDPALEEEQKLRRKVTKGAWSIAKDKANIHLSMEKVQSYEEAFAKIQKATRITDIDELVQTFVQAEDTNFALFNYVNDLASEIEKLEDLIESIRVEINKYQSGAGESSDSERKKLLSEFELKFQLNQQISSQYEDKYNNSTKTIQTLKTGISNIFNRLGCNNRDNSAVLGNAGVTESNMMQYLGLIEARTNELLELYLLHRREEEEEKQSQLASSSNNNPSTNTDPVPASYNPSTARTLDEEEGSDNEDGELQPSNQRVLSNHNSSATAAATAAGPQPNNNHSIPSIQAPSVNAPSSNNNPGADNDDSGDSDDELPVNTDQLQQQAADRLRQQ